jgi:hypothetical protein
MELSESFYIFLTTTAAGIFLGILKLVYDSKCKKINMCGVQIERDTQAEASIEHDRMEHGIINNPIDSRQSLDRPRSNSN